MWISSLSGDFKHPGRPMQSIPRRDIDSAAVKSPDYRSGRVIMSLLGKITNLESVVPIPRTKMKNVASQTLNMEELTKVEFEEPIKKEDGEQQPEEPPTEENPGLQVIPDAGKLAEEENVHEEEEEVVREPFSPTGTSASSVQEEEGENEGDGNAKYSDITDDDDDNESEYE